MDNIYDLFRPEDPEAEKRWVREAIDALEKPKTLTARNWVQVMLADRYAVQFRVSRLVAVERIAKEFADKFPH